MERLTRRNFLQGLGLAGAGALTAGALAACSPGSASNSSGSAANSDTSTGSTGTAGTASGNWTDISESKLDWLPEEMADPTDIESEESCDVVVVGTGVAGTAAARSAAEAGARVIVIEKAEEAGVSRSGEYAILGGKMMDNWGRGDGYLDKDECVDHEMDEMCYYPKREIYSKWAYGCGEVFDWWCSAKPDMYIHLDGNEPIPDEYNVDDDEHLTLYSYFSPLPEHFQPDFYKSEKHPTFPSSVTFYPSQSNIVKANVKKAEEAGATIYTSHFAEKLIFDGAKVSGLYARNAGTGSYKKITAESVVLATGDYSSNDDIMRYYCPEVYQNQVPKMFPNVDCEGNLTNMGDGMWMGAWIGADIQQRHAPMIHYMGQMTMGEGTVGGVGTSPFLRLSRYGKRFMDEDVPGQQVQNALETCPGKTCWTIFDSKWAEQVPWFQPMHGSVNYVVDVLPNDENPNNKGFLKDGIYQYIRRDACEVNAAVEGSGLLVANTIDELLDKCETLEDKEAAKASIDRYNQFAKAGRDEDYNKRADRLFPVETGPFYAFESGMSAMLVCCGGLVSDEECHVYDKEGTIIPGIYVAGNIQGNRYAVAYPIAFKGVSHSLCMYYGYVAGQNAVSGV
ncbi:MAG: FAD-dependent oxidoreductase [Coriobacteriales bacterium]|nr:FAD-dependent oxidoreductase [Coriobacteriales bacterium]